MGRRTLAYYDAKEEESDWNTSTRTVTKYQNDGKHNINWIFHICVQQGELWAACAKRSLLLISTK
jgi:hypothetical protein